MPAREVRGADVAHFPVADELVERCERLVDIGLRVEPVELVEVDVLRAEPAQARLARADEMIPRAAGVVRAVAHRKVRLGREEDVVAAARVAAPRISSASPCEQTSAVSKRFAPASRQTSTSRRAPSASVEPQALKKSFPPPNVAVPNESAGTLRPLRPSNR